ncbi:hypothetical protein [Bradyrhizobium sp. AZCC 2289]|uniref:hypothetical protein n=1 Tax=Bradyrhizobium sp. AZCC 2289 TaxID=3117026 RepID=UPI002FF27E55
MVGNSTHLHSSDPPVAALEEDINDPGFAHYRYRRSHAAEISSDGPAPLFLSGDADDNAPQIRKRRAISPSRILTVISAASAAAMVLALFSVDATRAVIVSAAASFAGASLAQLSAPPPEPVQTVALAPPAGTDLPSRDEIAAAYQAAIKSLVAVAETPATPAVPAPPPARHLDPDDLAALLKRAKGLLANGDIASARLLLERAADAREADAALLLARTYDPAVLGTGDARSVTPDPARARNWYQKAAEFGSSDAQARVAEMQN